MRILPHTTHTYTPRNNIVCPKLILTESLSNLLNGYTRIMGEQSEHKSIESVQLEMDISYSIDIKPRFNYIYYKVKSSSSCVGGTSLCRCCSGDPKLLNNWWYWWTWGGLNGSSANLLHKTIHFGIVIGSLFNEVIVLFYTIMVFNWRWFDRSRNYK